MSVFSGLVVGIVIVFLFWCYDIYRKNKMVEKIPGPSPIPFIGLKLPTNIYDVAVLLQDYFKKYGDTVKFYIGGNLQIVTCDPKLIEALMKSNTHLTKSQLYDLTRDWLKDGLIVSTGLKYKERRKYLTPSFHYGVLKEFFPIFKERSDVLVQKLGEQADKGAVINVIDFISKFALDVVGETSLGIKLNLQEEGSKEYIQAVNKFSEIFCIRNFSMWKRFDLPFKLFAEEYKEHKEALEILNGTSSKIIKQTRNEFQTRSSKYAEQLTDEADVTKKKYNLINALLENPELTNEDIQEEVNNFMFAGYDTTSTAISLILFELSKHQHIQEKLYSEIKDAINNDVQNITQEILQDMTYLDMILKEVFRIRTPIPLVERRLEEDAKLADIVYPKGTTISMVIYCMHRNGKYFPEPEKFDPERFNPNNPHKPSTNWYAPFSAGPRSCIGQKYALLEVKIVVAKLIMTFRILPVDNVEVIVGMSGILRFKNGFPVKLERRK